MEHIYDKVQWSFPLSVLRYFGFSKKWIQIISQCMSLVSYSILLNGILLDWLSHLAAWGKGSLYPPSPLSSAPKFFPKWLRERKDWEMCNKRQLILSQIFLVLVTQLIWVNILDCLLSPLTPNVKPTLSLKKNCWRDYLAGNPNYYHKRGLSPWSNRLYQPCPLTSCQTSCCRIDIALSLTH